MGSVNGTDLQPSSRRQVGIFANPVRGGAILERMVAVAVKIITTKARSHRPEVMGRHKEPKNAYSPARQGNRSKPS